MYHFDKRAHKHAKLKKRLLWLLLVLFFAAFLYILFHVRIAPKQDTKSSPSVSKAYAPTTERRQVITKPELTFEATSGWKETPVPQTAYSPRYVYKDVKNARILEIYIDNPPQHFGVNKAIVVDSSNGLLSHDSVSDNCTTFTDGTNKDQRTGISPAKWQEVDFLCDMSNSARAVVGTISNDGINTIIVTTASGRTYKVFITYTDNNINPDYNVFYELLNSMHFQ